MPWRWAILRGQKVLARATASGALAESGGRVEIRYKPGDARAYQAAVRNLVLGSPELLPDDTCPAGEAVARKEASEPKRAASRGAKEPILHSKTAFVAYTDGACKGNPGAASASCILVAPDGEVIEEALYLGHATNNVAELTGVDLALNLAPKDQKLILHTDSSYAIGVLSKGWKAKANQELVARIKRVIEGRDVSFVHVRGHAGIPLNERADELANDAIRQGRSFKVVHAAPKARSSAT